MPGFIDTHHHQFETALRSFLANGILINDGSGSPSANPTYYEYILLTFAPVYRPQDVYISELFGGLAQLDDGVTTVHDISQIHHSPSHSDAAIQGIMDSGRRAAFGYFEGAGFSHGPDYKYPDDAVRIKKQWFSSSDQLVTMIMGGEIYLPGYERAWQIGRQLGLQVAAHILSPFGMRPTFDLLAQGHGGDSGTLGIGSDNLFVHMTGMSDAAWQKVKDLGAQVSLAVPIEMNMRHGTPPVLTMESLKIEPSLSSDVEVTLLAGAAARRAEPAHHTRRAALRHRQRRERPAARSQDRLPHAGQGGRHHHARRDRAQRGAAQPGAGGGRLADGPQQRRDRDRRGQGGKWKGRLLDVDLPQLSRQLEASRDHIFAAAGI